MQTLVEIDTECKYFVLKFREEDVMDVEVVKNAVAVVGEDRAEDELLYEGNVDNKAEVVTEDIDNLLLK